MSSIMSDDELGPSESSSDERDSTSIRESLFDFDLDDSSSSFSLGSTSETEDKNWMMEAEAQRKKTLNRLRMEEKGLMRTVEEEKRSLCKVHRENVRKEGLLRRLRERFALKRKIREEGKQPNLEFSSKIARKNPAFVFPVLMKTRGTQDRGRGGKEVDAAAVFPEVTYKKVCVWEMILGYVTDPADRWSCYNACPLFRRILHQWKTTWLFEKALPYLFPNLPGDKLMECRLVSKGWKEEMDHYLLNHPTLRPHNEETCDPRTLPFVSPTMEKNGILSEELVFYFDGNNGWSAREMDLDDPEYLATTWGKLMSGRRALVTVRASDDWRNRDDDDDEEDEGNEQLWRKVHRFFLTFGEHIWYLRMDFDYSDRECFIRKLVHFLTEDLFQLAPNLRSLYLGNQDDDPRNLNEVVVDKELFPSAASLETLEVAYGQGACFRSFILPFLAKYHFQLGKVIVEAKMWKRVCHLDWPNLTELLLDTPRNMGTLKRLLSGAMPKLTKLGLGFSTDRSDNNGLAELLEIIDNLCKTTRLTTLRLVEGVHHDVLRKPQGRLSFVKASNLKTLELDYRGGTVPHPRFQFLLYFSHLENLNVYWRELAPLGVVESEVYLRPNESFKQELEEEPDCYDEDKEERQFSRGFTYLRRPKIVDVAGELKLEKDEEEEVLEVNKYMYSGEMYKSNIWELLPRLKVFTFQREVYTRGGYEDYCRKKERSA